MRNWARTVRRALRRKAEGKFPYFSRNAVEAAQDWDRCAVSEAREQRLDAGLPEGFWHPYSMGMSFVSRAEFMYGSDFGGAVSGQDPERAQRELDGIKAENAEFRREHGA